jgi:hypothetical protein
MLTKETTAEFAAGDIHAATANPFDVTRFAGSSSAGSGAAVADYQCHMALGTQTVSPSTVGLELMEGCFAHEARWVLWDLWV